MQLSRRDFLKISSIAAAYTFVPSVAKFLLAETIADGKINPQTKKEAELKIRINIPAFRADLIVDGKLESSYKIAVGMPWYPTPRGNIGAIQRIEFNPWWFPPKSSKWAAKDKATPPGPKNPLGKVKMHINDKVLMHGTNKDKSIGTAASHACMRMHNGDALALANALIEKVGGKKEGKAFVLSRKIPVLSEYKTIEARIEKNSDSVKITFYPDVYGKNTTSLDNLKAALFNEGVPPRLVGSDAELASVVDCARAALKEVKEFSLSLAYKLPDPAGTLAAQ